MEKIKLTKQEAELICRMVDTIAKNKNITHEEAYDIIKTQKKLTVDYGEFLLMQQEIK